MSLADSYNRGKESGSLNGTLTNTLHGQTLGPAPTSGGGGAPDVDFASPGRSLARSQGLGMAAGAASDITGGQGHMQLPASGRFAPPGAMPQAFQNVLPGGITGSGTILDPEKQRELAEGASGLLSGAAEVVSWPFKMIGDILGHLDRPQQALFAAITRGLEEKDAWTGLQAGFSAGVFRRPDPGGPKRRVEAEDLIRTVGREVFGKRDILKGQTEVGKFALGFAVTVAVDPLLFVPGAWYSKAGAGIKTFHRQLIAADHARYAVTKGTGMADAAAIATNNAISDWLFQAGKSKGPLGQVLHKVSEDMVDDEIKVIRDLVTGYGIRHVADELQPLMMRAASGEGASYAEVSAILKEATAKFDEKSVGALSEEISRIVANRRNSSEYASLFEISVGGAKKQTNFDMAGAVGTPLEREYMIGQLVNRAGLDPTEGIAASVSGLVRTKGKKGGVTQSDAGFRQFFDKQLKARKAELAKKGIVVKGSKVSTTLEAAWDGLSKRARIGMLKRNQQVNPGDWRNGRGKMRNIQDVSSMSYKKAKSFLDPEERAALQRSFIQRETKGLGKVELSLKEFADRNLITSSTLAKPKNASKAYVAAMERSAGNGRYIIDSVVEAQLGARYKKIGLVSESARDMADIAAGVKAVDAGSELPNAASKSDALRSFFDASLRDTKDIHMLHFMMDPKQVLPGAVYSRGKYGEDLYMSVNNAIGGELDKIMKVGGKSIAEGGKMDRKLGLAAFGDEMEELLRRGKTRKGAAINSATREFAERAVKARDEVKMDDGAAQVLRDMKGVMAGFREGFIRRGQPEMAQGGLDDYFARIYPDFENSVRDAVKNGMLTAKEGKHMLKRGKRDINTALMPLEMDFVDPKKVHFRHMSRRSLEEPLPGLETSAISLMRGYVSGSLKKMYIEPAVQDMNRLGANLPKWKKRYLNLFLKRMLGYDIGDEAMLNHTFEAINGIVGKGINKATFGMVKANQFEVLRPATRASLIVTRNFYRGLLGGNLGFMLKNFTQGLNTMVEAGPLATLQGAAMLALNPVVDVKTGKKFRDVVKSRNMLRNFNSIMENSPSSNLMSSGWKKAGIKLDKLLFWPATFSENMNRGVAMSAGMTQFMKTEKALVGGRNLRELFEEVPDVFDEAVRYGHAIANETQFVYGVVGRSPIAGSVTGRLGLQFFSWPVKQIAFLQNGWKDEGMMFMMRYIAFAGLASSIAEHAEVDAGGFTGFGFMPSQKAPSMQALGHLFGAVTAASIEDNHEATEKHLDGFVNVVENMIPAFLAFSKLTSTAQSIETGEQRGARGRFTRRTDDPNREQRLSRVLDETINQHLSFNVSGEQAVGALMLPSATRNRYREGLKDMQRSIRNENVRHRKFVDDYIRASGTGNYVTAERIKKEAMAEGVYLDGAAINREVMTKQIPSIDRILASSRALSRSMHEAELMDKDPETFRHIPGLSILPPNLLGGVRE